MSEEKGIIDSIVEILYRYERDLSDGYEFYSRGQINSEHDDFYYCYADEIIYEIANKIYKIIDHGILTHQKLMMYVDDENKPPSEICMRYRANIIRNARKQY